VTAPMDAWFGAGASGLGLLAGLRSFARHPISTDLAAARLRTRRAARGEALATAVRRASQAHTTPYPALLGTAGVTASAVEQLIQRGGVEHALTDLLNRGVCLSVEELAGLRAVVRRGRVLHNGIVGGQAPRERGRPQVERHVPLAGRTGKTLHLHRRSGRRCLGEVTRNPTS
jgi:hypothetical protein